MFNINERDKMKAEDVITQMTSGDTFYITYYAKKHQAIITRKGTWTKPNTDTQGKHFVSKDGNDVFIYWDLNAEPNKNGNRWRHATNPLSIKL
jgi:hypothetical protein|tara:strand:- start:265 stop:543 length:279 start_codon:yes stop_codon:yes gene_type:complete